MTWGRLALIHAAGESDDALKAVAHILGYEAESLQAPDDSPHPPPGNSGSSDTIEPIKQPVNDSFKAVPQLSARFLRVNKLIQHADPSETESHPRSYLHDPSLRLTADAAPKGTYFFASPNDAFSMPRLLPLLHNALGQPRQGCRIDYSRLTRLLANCRPIRRLPQLTRLRWPQRLQIIVDTRATLEPYGSDFAAIVAQLKKHLGDEAVTSLRFLEETLGKHATYAIAWPTQSTDEWFPWRIPANDHAILILSDLGSNDSNADARLRWQQWLRRLQFHPAPVLTLSPASQSVQNKRLCRIAKPSPLNDRIAPPRHPSQRGFRLPQADAETMADILALLSPLPLIDKGLLRQLRQAFQWGRSDLEQQIWNHPDMRPIGGLGIHLSEIAAKYYQQRYREKFADTPQAARLWEIVQAHHHEAFEGLRQLENMNRYVLESNDDNQAASYYFRRLSATVTQTDVGAPQKQALLQQCRTVLQHLPDQVWQSRLDDVAYDLYAMAHREDIRAGRWPDKLKPGFDPNRLLWVLDPKQQTERVHWSIHQTGPQGEIVCRQQIPANERAPAIIQFEAHPAFPPTYRLQGEGEGEQKFSSMRDGQVFYLKDNTLTIKTQKQQLELEAIEKPAWANDIWCNAEGLTIQLPPWRGVSPTVQWQPGKSGENGFFPLPAPFVVDQFGLYVDLEILSQGFFKKLFGNSNSIIQRFRWIIPGRFMMGSPESEPERYDGETQHPVTLTHGFWLADSACTQALWQAVMGNNPARFQESENNPVETVSWDDTQAFITQLSTLFPDLSARLPTEAEWEYACRAGTESPFSFGSNMIPEQVNYNGDYPYADGQKGLYREKTVPVKSLPPNAWGLYEMHGNVFEWCADWYGDYPRQAVTDPMGPDQGTTRVLRGGSWYGIGGIVRSANRGGYGPGDRNGRIGFRLALG